jgi:catechol 2,3-dioxygenase-like lactoylglutathione lyase family enzyme
MRKVALVVVSILLLTGPATTAGDRAAAVGPIGLTVRSIDTMAAFLERVLDFERISDVEASGRDVELLYGVFGARVRVVMMKLGDEQIELTEFLAPRGRDYPADTRANDQWFQHIAVITSDMTTAYARLRAHGIPQASTAPQRLPDWNKGAAGIEAFYFRSPEGHFIEILSFPRDKGAAKWQRRDRLFLGIDHTAIVSTDTERSIAFYRDGLGLSVAGNGENYGVEQEHLNNVFGVRLLITTLRAPVGPGIELLEYLTPRDGRPVGHDLKANDLAHWHTTVSTSGLERFVRTRFGGWLVSPMAVTAPPLIRGPGLLMRDPDGHGVRLVSAAPTAVR